MKKILVIGAGLSSSYLIKYLLDNAATHDWQVTVADSNIDAAATKIAGHQRGVAVSLNAYDHFELEMAISQHDLVISLLPPTLHIEAARFCIKLRKHLVTASYISADMQSLHVEALKADVLLLNECGLDPGIDHMSAMRIIHKIQAAGGTVTSFKSFCGGLVAPEFDDNPWNYKFTWNPRNVVLAGQATARYLENGELKFIPPARIFTQTEPIFIEGYGSFESYANRDSLSYIKPYGIESARTVLRGTLRRKGYSDNWNNLVKLGLTDDSFLVFDADKLTYRDLTSAFTPGSDVAKLEERVCTFLGITPESTQFRNLEWLGLFSKEPIRLAEGTPAQIMQILLQHKWKLNKGELDMIVMHHGVQYETGNARHEISSALVTKGESDVLTAMAKTVGLPMAMAAKLLLTGNIKTRGVHMPLAPEFYDPILDELETYGVSFTEHVI